MRYVRAIIRLTALVLITTAYYLLYILGLPFVFALPKGRLRLRGQCCKRWARLAAKVLGLGLTGINGPPTAPFFLVSNHLSYIDVIVLQSQLDCAFIAKREVASWPFLGIICRTMDTIFVDRRTRRDIPAVLKKIETTIGRGLGVVLFAEGTSTNGRSVAPFKSSLLEVAAVNRVPVHYASICYAAPSNEVPAEQSICWWGNMTFPDHLFRLLQLPSFEARVVYGPEAIVADDRRVLAANLWSAVCSQLPPAIAQR